MVICKILKVTPDFLRSPCFQLVSPYYAPQFCRNFHNLPTFSANNLTTAIPRNFSRFPYDFCGFPHFSRRPLTSPQAAAAHRSAPNIQPFCCAAVALLSPLPDDQVMGRPQWPWLLLAMAWAAAGDKPHTAAKKLTHLVCLHAHTRRICACGVYLFPNIVPPAESTSTSLLVL